VKLVCVVLAGGESRRMGGAKPLQPFDDETLIARAVELARGYADDVSVAVRDRAQAGETDVRLIFDDPAVEGPLGGLAAALDHAQALAAEGVLTIPCDAPLLPADLATRLSQALAPSAGAAVAASGGRLHPVCALWRTSVRDRLPAYLATGRRSLHGFAETCGGVTVEWPDGPSDPFANANTPEELADLQAGRPTW
jgi:molybdopterin-guanine dinucleotide biosynthesis protein A